MDREHVDHFNHSAMQDLKHVQCGTSAIHAKLMRSATLIKHGKKGCRHLCRSVASTMNASVYPTWMRENRTLCSPVVVFVIQKTTLPEAQPQKKKQHMQTQKTPGLVHNP